MHSQARLGRQTDARPSIHGTRRLTYRRPAEHKRFSPVGENALYYGDNLEVLRRYIGDESVDLVYLDPPFKSNQDYNVLFAAQDGTRSPAQIKAFEDTWTWDQAAARNYEESVERGGPISLALQSFRTSLGENDMLAYLSMTRRPKPPHRLPITNR